MPSDKLTRNSGENSSDKLDDLTVPILSPDQLPQVQQQEDTLPDPTLPQQCPLPPRTVAVSLPPFSPCHQLSPYL